MLNQSLKKIDLTLRAVYRDARERCVRFLSAYVGGTPCVPSIPKLPPTPWTIHAHMIGDEAT